MLWFEDIVLVGLGSFRFGGLIASMPVFGTSPFPGFLKFFLAVALSFSVLPMQPDFPSILLESPGALFLVALREAGLGLLMGFTMRFLFLAITTSLELSGIQMGFGIASVFDPTNNSQASIVAQLGAVLAILLFFVANLHHQVFFILAKSFEKIPMGLPDWQTGEMIARLLSFVKDSFEVSLRMAFPVLAAMLVIHLVMGLIARTAPQMNLFFNMAFIVNIVTGLLLVAMSWSRMFPQFQKLSQRMAATGYGLW